MGVVTGLAVDATGAAGQAVAIWVRDGVHAARRGADGVWGAPQRIAPPGRYPLDGGEVAIDTAGNTLVVIRAFDLETYSFRVLTIAQRATKPTWEAPFWLSPKGPTEGAPGPRASIVADGARSAAGVARPRGGAPTATVIKVATRPALRAAG